MRKLIAAALMALGLVALEAAAHATPSTQIWIPSTDIQQFGTLHLNYDVYSRLENEASGQRKPTQLWLGPTVGVLPFDKIQMEAGFDLVFQGDPKLDKNPAYLHAKIATPEGSVFKYSPAIAVGMYDAGFDPKLTALDVGYGLVAKTLPVIGRLSGGYYLGRKALLVDGNGNPSNRGLMLSWDRTLNEISPKLWAAVDYMGGNSSLSALNGGVSWAFSDNVSVILGYDHYLDRIVAGRDTFTVQLDINMFTKPAAAPATPQASSDQPADQGQNKDAQGKGAQAQGASGQGGSGQGSQDQDQPKSDGQPADQAPAQATPASQK